MPLLCIFCENEAGSKEHLWPAWMHRLIKFGPLRTQEGNNEYLVEDDPEKTIDTVCRTCNNGWMSRLEEKNISRLKPMFLNLPLILDRGGLRLLTEWAVKTAMMSDSVKPRNGNVNFYTLDERTAFKETRSIPDRTRVWIGALTHSHLGCHGTDVTIMGITGEGSKIRTGMGSASTIYAGHFVAQVFTEHIRRQFDKDQVALVQPIPSVCERKLIQIYPYVPQRVNWQESPFTNDGPESLAGLIWRWRVGEKVDIVTA